MRVLPAAYQVPAAILLVIGGLVACFAGYRVFRTVLGIYGFIFGAFIATSAMGTSDTAWLVGAAVVGGIIGALILMAAYFIGVALIGAGLAALAVTLVWGQLGGEPPALAIIVAAVIGALASLSLQRYVIILGTAFGGAWTLLIGALALAGNRSAEIAAATAAERPDVWVLYPSNPAPGQMWVPIAGLVIGLVGVFVQMKFTAKK
ncbi:MAG: TMEM198/TM7SF3 family protein [Acidobacteriota bacterium]|nr:TMEM198/TM7SF3 family protein [Acidobacteriota bacterium]